MKEIYDLVANSKAFSPGLCDYNPQRISSKYHYTMLYTVATASNFWALRLLDPRCYTAHIPEQIIGHYNSHYNSA